ncbi:MAG: hypothetical protein BIFFINMI_02197 [Phycisphaerae bacterium]|nr:hypothetical protein [Phycisphaerae bacterium]
MRNGVKAGLGNRWIAGYNPAMIDSPDISLIVPIYHSGPMLREMLASARAQTDNSARLELLVAGPADDEASRRIVADEAAVAGFPIRYVPAPCARRAALLNAACAQARGRLFAFVDDDVVLVPGWLDKLTDLFRADPDLGIVGGPDRLADRPRALDVAFDCILHSLLGSGGARSGRGPRLARYCPRLWNMALPRAVAEAAALPGDGPPGLRLFDDSLEVCEDLELGRRIEAAGRRVAFAPELIVRHRRDTTFGAIVGREFLLARTSRRLGIRRGPHRLLAGGLMAGLLLAVAAFFVPAARVALIGGAGLYAAALLVVGLVGLLRTRRLAVLVIVPALLACLHFARAAGYLVPARPGALKGIDAPV